MLLINNNTLTLTSEGKVYSKELSQEELAMVKVYALDNDIDSIIDLCFPTPANLLKKEGFWEEDGSIYYKNIKVSIPKILIDKLLEADPEEYDRLIKFWCWLSLNPNPETREHLYDWVSKHGVQLTNGGLMVLYRRVIKVKSINDLRTDLTEFVRTQYRTLKDRKKRTNITVWQDNESNYYLGDIDHGDTLIGNLYGLYNHVYEGVYTDAHTRTKRYVIGEEAREPRSAGDERSSVSCSFGLHMSHKKYSFSGFGDTPIAVVVNPCDILAVPDNGAKIRSCAMTPVAILNSDAEWADDKEVHQRIDACYDQAVERLETLLSEATFEDFKKHEILSTPWNLQVGFETILNILN